MSHHPHQDSSQASADGSSVRSSGTDGRPKRRRKRHSRTHVDADDESNSEDRHERHSSDAGTSQSDFALDVQENQEWVNLEHPFGLKIWKPSLYRKHRTIDQAPEEAVLGDPIYRPTARPWLHFGNILYTLLFGWILALLYAAVGLLLMMLWGFGGAAYWILRGRLPQLWWPLERCGDYAAVLFNLALYVLFPFGKQVERVRLAVFRPGAVEAQSRHVFLDPEVFALPKEHDITVGSMGNVDIMQNENETTPLMVEYEDRQDRSRRRNSQDIEDGPVQEQDAVPERGWFRRMLGIPAYTRITPASLLFRILVLVTIAPVQMLVCAVCWLGVIPIPTAQLLWILLRHLVRTPLRLRSRSPSCPPLFLDAQDVVLSYSQQDMEPGRLRPFRILLRAIRGAFQRFKQLLYGYNQVDLSEDADRAREAERQREEQAELIIMAYFATNARFIKYTVEGINVILVNLLICPVLTLVLAFLLPRFGVIVPDGLLFVLALVSVIPCSYFIGQSVASITASTGSLALGAVINATFGSIVEILLYCFAIKKGQDQIVQGSIIGSFLLGLLALPGIAMFSSGVVKKVNRFNVQSAGVTITLLLFTVIAVFTPTIFHMVYANWEFACGSCSQTPGYPDLPPPPPAAAHMQSTRSSLDLSRCRNCRFWQPHPRVDPFYDRHTKPLMLICCVALLLLYMLGLFFTLLTHQKQIYAQKKRMRLKRIARTRRDTPVSTTFPKPPVFPTETNGARFETSGSLASAVPKPWTTDAMPIGRSPRLAPLQPKLLASMKRQVPKIDTSITPRDLLGMSSSLAAISVVETASIQSSSTSSSSSASSVVHGPNWSRMKAVWALLTVTVLFAGVAEVLVDSVDSVVGSVGAKFLGLTLFAIAPSASEIYNAVAFAVNKQMQLSMEIANAYTSQVAMLQIPVVVFFSTWWESKEGMSPLKGFTLVFPRQDALSVFLAVFLLAYVYVEGKATYLKGATLSLAYLILLSGFYYVPPHDIESFDR